LLQHLSGKTIGSIAAHSRYQLEPGNLPPIDAYIFPVAKLGDIQSLSESRDLSTLMLAPLPTRQMMPFFSKAKPCSIACHVAEELPVNTVSNKDPLG
jgi:hypothetical protein